MLERGTEVGGYRIDGLLGMGGMGVVYAATQKNLNRSVALKILSTELATDGSFRERFRREGEIQASIDHPNIVTIYEAGTLDDQHLFIAMRLIRGPSLKELIVARELDAARTLRILRPIADALDTAHEFNLTHRDIKPQNILVDARDRGFLADFGLTKGVNDAGLTRTGEFVGTIDYTSPEQIGGEEATSCSDLYALTAVLYECLTGVVPYPKPSDAAVLYAHLADPPPLVTDQRPELPAALDEVIAKGMAKNPKDRFSTGAELMDAAERAFGRRIRAALAPPGPIEVPEEAGIREPEQKVGTRETRVRRTPPPLSDTPPQLTPVAEAAAATPEATPSAPGSTPAGAPATAPSATPSAPAAAPSGPAAAPSGPAAAPSGPAAAPSARAAAPSGPAAAPSGPAAAPSGPDAAPSGPAAAPSGPAAAPSARAATPSAAPATAPSARAATPSADPATAPSPTPSAPAAPTAPTPQPPATGPSARASGHAPTVRSAAAEPAPAETVVSAAAAAGEVANGAGAVLPETRVAGGRKPPGDQPPTRVGARRGSFAPAERKRPAAALAITAAAAGIVAALAGFLIASGGDDEPTATTTTTTKPAALTQSAASGGVEVRFPSTWKRDSAQRVPGVDIEGGVALASATPGAGLVAGYLANAGGDTLLGSELASRLSPAPEPTDRVRVGDVQAYRYENVKVDGSTKTLRLFTAPTSEGVAAVACFSEPDDAEAFAPECERVAQTLKLVGGDALDLGPSAAYGRALDGVIQDLNQDRVAGRRALAAAKTPKGQASRAAALEDAYAAARRRLAGADPTPMDEAAHTSIMAALERARAGYAGLASAARNNRRAAYAAAEKRVAGAEAALTKAIEDLKALGYDV